MTTPKRVTTTDGDDIHEKVQILYDMATSSMDWGSGMLDDEEMVAVMELAVLMGWQLPTPDSHDPVWRSFARRHPEHYEIVLVPYTPDEVKAFGRQSRDMPVREKIVPRKKD